MNDQLFKKINFYFLKKYTFNYYFCCFYYDLINIFFIILVRLVIYFLYVHCIQFYVTLNSSCLLAPLRSPFNSLFIHSFVFYLFIQPIQVLAISFYEAFYWIILNQFSNPVLSFIT